MSQGEDDFKAKRAFGKRAEVSIAKWLGELGHYTLPAYDFSGHDDNLAPKLMTAYPRRSLIAPDLLVGGHGKCFWLEVKHKSRADYTRITGRLETGCSLRHFEHYREVQLVTGLDVYLLFVHRAEGEVRGEKLDKLETIKRIYAGEKMDRSGMIFFPWEALRVFGTLADDGSIKPLRADV